MSKFIKSTQRFLTCRMRTDGLGNLTGTRSAVVRLKAEFIEQLRNCRLLKKEWSEPGLRPRQAQPEGANNSSKV
jgi:hypothetical protein